MGKINCYTGMLRVKITKIAKLNNLPFHAKNYTLVNTTYKQHKILVCLISLFPSGTGAA